ncbi:MAG: alpha/beta hydrolase [Bacteroidetes bacterium]|nr:alpha/beta hydrolase [Bacteroidota bacterium]
MASQAKIEEIHLFSPQVRDSFALVIDAGIQGSHLVIYADAGLILGERVRTFREQDTIFQSDTFTFVGIKHLNNGRSYRRRDFILPQFDTQSARKPMYGYADSFLSFLTTDVVSYLNSRFKPSSKTLIGHSLSGLFATYAYLTKPELFDHYIIISPSYWVNQYAALELPLPKPDTSLHPKVYFGWGSFEQVNQIQSGLIRMRTKMETAGSRHEHSFWMHRATTHTSVIPRCIRDGLYWMYTPKSPWYFYGIDRFGP